MVLLYIGAGTDPLPSLFWPKTENLVYVDQIPGDRLRHYDPDMVGAQENRTFQTYLSYLILNFQKTGHTIDEIEIDTQVKLLTLHLDLNGFKRKLFYFYNTVFPEECPPKLVEFLNQTEHWYLCGYVPEFEFIKGQIVFPGKLKINHVMPNLKLISATELCHRELPKFVPGVTLEVISESIVVDPMSEIYRTDPTFSGLPILVAEIHKHIPKRFSSRHISRFSLSKVLNKLNNNNN